MALIGCGHVQSNPIADGNAGPGQDGGVPDTAVPDAPARRWQLVQTASADSATVPVKPLGAGHLVVVAVEVARSGLVTAITDSSGCNSYVAIPTAHATSVALDVNLQLFYAKNSCAQADAISIATTTSVFAAAAWEVAGIRTDQPVDAAAVLNDQAASSSPVGPPLTTSAAGDFVVAVALVNNMITGIHAGNEFTNDHGNFGNGWAHLTDPMAAAGVHQARWDQSQAGAYCASAAAFQVGP